MARRPRIWYEGASYHITCRGNHQNDIFNDRSDYKVYLRILEKVKGELDFNLCAYCLMTNHVHLLIQTKESSISDIMKKINMLYVNYYNRKYNKVGRLFQGRYGAKLIGDHAYLLELSRYIHLNPVRANIVEKPEEYEWSSYSMYIGLMREKLIHSEDILDRFAAHKSRSIYKEFVEMGMRKDKVSYDDYGDMSIIS